MTTRIVIVDDQYIFREGLRAVLAAQPDFLLIGEAYDARSAYAIVESRTPDVVIIDISLPGTSGIACTRELLRKRPDTKILILTMHSKWELIAEAFEAGAHGYAFKDDAPSVVEGGIRAVARGERFLSPRIPKSLLNTTRSTADPLTNLSPREREIFNLVVRGFSNENVARELCISVKTVQTHRAKINEKLSVHSSAELVRFAALRGLISE